MSEEEIKNILFSDPVGFFESFDKKGLNFDSLKKLEISKLIVREKFPELVKEEDFQAAESLFWISYFAERDLRDSILFVETSLGKKSEDVEVMLDDDMTFGQKIQFVPEKYYSRDAEPSEYIKILRVIKNLRNHLAHGRLEHLTYKGYSFSDPRACTILLVDLMNAARPRSPKSARIPPKGSVLD
ncbi:MAG: hypothetical protein AAB345_03340 [Patescibacteria group bacterium]